MVDISLNDCHAKLVVGSKSQMSPFTSHELVDGLLQKAKAHKVPIVGKVNVTLASGHCDTPQLEYMRPESASTTTGVETAVAWFGQRRPSAKPAAETDGEGEADPRPSVGQNLFQLSTGMYPPR